MSKVIIEESSLEDIADSIRAKNGSNSLYKPAEMSEAIDDIESVSDYISGNLSGGSSFGGGAWINSIKKLPPLANTGTSCLYLYRGFKGNQIDFSLLNTANVTTMQNMFYECSGLTSLNLSFMDTSKVTTMKSMFFYCSNLVNIILGNLNTSELTDIESMFFGCSNLTSLDLSGLNTSKVTTMKQMFQGCTKLASLNLANINTSSVINMSSMFSGEQYLTSLDLSSFTFKQNTDVDVSSMFHLCTKLMHLDIRGLDFTYITKYTSMFGNSSLSYQQVPADCEIIVKDNDAKAWINEKFPKYTNVKTVAEYEAE